MAFLQGHLHDVFAAEPDAELVCQFGDAGLVMVVAAVEGGLCRRQFFADRGGQGDGVDAESGLYPVELGGKQAGEMRGAAAGTAGAGFQAGYGAVRVV